MNENDLTEGIDVGRVMLIPMENAHWAVGWVVALGLHSFWLAILNYTLTDPNCFDSKEVNENRILAIFQTLDGRVYNGSWKTQETLIPLSSKVHLPIFKLDNGPEGLWLTNYRGVPVRRITPDQSNLLEYEPTLSPAEVEICLTRILATTESVHSDVDRPFLYSEIKRIRNFFS